MKAKHSWMYICRATIARKYIVPSVTIVRTTAESLSAPILWYVHQAMTRNADSSRRLARSEVLDVLVEQVQSLTKRGSDHIRDHLEHELRNGWAEIGNVELDWEERREAGRQEKSRHEGYG